MFECRGCGGNLKFDIASQMMLCPYCDSSYDPYEVSENHEADEVRMNVTVFICPQCGGEIYSADTSAAEFCSFCGASTILNTRMQKEKRPLKIVPFKITKDAGKDAYRKYLKRCIYAPKALRTPEGTNEFRGIYMPYWCYNISQKGRAYVNGKTESRSGDYIVKKIYKISGDLDAGYENIPYDSASNFADDISERIAPYDTKEMCDFTPAFLSGFYADIADVNDNVYHESVKEFANSETLSRIQSEPAVKKLSSVTTEDPGRSFNTTVESAVPVMLPVWFMSYRNNDRISYATINAQTGKVAADIPIDMRKFFLGAAVLFVVIDTLLNLFVSFSTKGMVATAGISALAVLIAYYVESYKIASRENGTKDLGKLSLIRKPAKNAKGGNTGKKVAGNSAAGTKNSSGNSGDNASENGSFKEVVEESMEEIVGFSLKSVPHYKAARPLIFAFILCAIVFIFEPHDDIWYYGTTVLTLLATTYSVFRLVQRFNIMASRKLPQLSRGGDSNAN